MVTEEIKARIQADMPDAEVEAQGDGSRMQIRVISNAFAGLSRVQKQQKVYGCINELIANGTLHAVSIQALTPEESQ
jgi:acid stress-induced BolA-like protein IbaG/YrbA